MIYYSICSALPTHSHPEGVKCAVVTSVLVWMALHGATKDEMKSYILSHYPEIPKTGRYFNQVHPNLTTYDLLQENVYHTNGVEGWTAVSLAFINFYETDSFEACLRNCLRYTCDTDTVMAISGGLAAAFYGNVPLENKSYIQILQEKLPNELFTMFNT